MGILSAIGSFIWYVVSRPFVVLGYVLRTIFETIVRTVVTLVVLVLIVYIVAWYFGWVVDPVTFISHL